MVDIKKLRGSKNQQRPINPIEIFNRMPKPAGLTDLYGSQKQVLEEWFQRRIEQDLLIKLHTGGGKTLVGLLIGQSALNEHRSPVIYLAPTNQLVNQIVDKASEYSIPVTAYQTGIFPDEFLRGEQILVCNYNSLFNGMSKFGVRGRPEESISAGTIILDDAHTSFSIVRDSFTLRIERNKSSKAYSDITSIFRGDFDDLGRLGTFNDIVAGIERGVLEVPYWNWLTRLSQIRGYLSDNKISQTIDSYKFVWPLLRDSLEYCHCFITQRAIAITPIFPLVDLIPTFSDCPRRIFMSATINDDSAIVYTFDTATKSTLKPIISESLAGISERMILSPELMKFSVRNTEILFDVVKAMVGKSDLGTAILVPSESAAKEWESIAEYASNSEQVADSVKQLQKGNSRGPFVFANRYDGIDLPGDACRLLIISGLPKGISEYDMYLASTGGSTFNTALAQRIEQGMGRAARGSGDYCVVIVTGKDLVSWLSRSANLNFLTAGTFAQFRIGETISKEVASQQEMIDTIELCLKRDQDWVGYHAEKLVDFSNEHAQQVQTSLDQADVERKAFQLMRDGYLQDAIKILSSYFEKEPINLSKDSKGWLEQYAARIAYLWGETQLSQSLQQKAFSDNSTLLRPKVIAPYIPITIPGEQAQLIVEGIKKFRPRRGYLVHFSEVVSHLVPDASSNLFEQSLADLGTILGFITERPEKTYKLGPDVLWLLSSNIGLVIEVKSRKKPENPLKKDEHGQLLVSTEWFTKAYPQYTCVRISVHHNITATKDSMADNSKVLTFERLNELVTEARILLSELCESVISDAELVVRCEQLLSDSHLNPDSLVKHYFTPFETVSG